VETLKQRLRRQEPEPGRSELESERQSVQRRQAAATAPALSGVSSNEPLVVLARSTNSAIAGYELSDSVDPGSEGGGSSSGASAYSRSAAILSRVLLVVTIRSPGQRSIRPATSEAADTTCSRLSRSRSAFLSAISAATRRRASFPRPLSRPAHPRERGETARGR